MDPLAIFDVEALMNVDKITKLHPQVVASDFINLNPPLLDVIRA